MIVGYTTGVYDLLHVGHVNLLRRARSLCDRLIVGVSSDELVQKNKGKLPVLDLASRLEIVAALKYVDAVVPQTDIDKFKVYKNFKFDILFVGDDWLGTPSWDEYEGLAAGLGVKIIYLPYTTQVSTTQLRTSLG
jgi:glycerol-3-phosphate cytidylyltransferase